MTINHQFDGIQKMPKKKKAYLNTNQKKYKKKCLKCKKQQIIIK